MPVTLTGASGNVYVFDIYTDKKSLPTNSGVYALLCQSTYGLQEYNVLYIGEAGNVHERLTLGDHDGLKCAEERCLYSLHIGVYDTIGLSKEQRLQIERDLIKKYNPICNNR